MTKVRFSTEARGYLAREAAYLKERSTTGASRFQRIVARARRQIETFPDSGYTDSVVSLTGARRMAIDEYLFDYDVTGDVATIMVIRHSRNTPTITLEDDADFEDPATPSGSRFGKR
ncbi:MAG TPA: type II toxin-antitoxin system RelE/ParE family toxin [Devosia sp.]|uniref:type II toxin-antitoxin system RelE/ParE family toxin n=1 Tax=Devosia sp. TaxID=1871048 RepID=UPI002DDC92BA|nr:type II toxin-antitoxin system RelE/ParE family toxin [Devosia sp.]HEV2514926.1 type II toxin-antitoxin system RelE/ParE family toxin [Devosia sp.]